MSSGNSSANDRQPLAFVLVSPPNIEPTGSVVIEGNLIQGQTLTATNNLADANGLGTFHYQWMAGATAIPGATASTLVLSSGEVGDAISVVVTYVDGQGYPETVSSSTTEAVQAPNVAPVFAHSAPGTFAYTSPDSDTAMRALVQADGSTIVAGTTGATGSEYVLFRLAPDGTLDTSFGDHGYATVTMAGTAQLNALVLGTDGSILIGGAEQVPGQNYEMTLVKLSAQGVLDTTFGSGGIAVSALTTRADIARAVLVQSDGKIIEAGYTTVSASSGTGNFRDFALLRYNTDGSLDTTFGTSGKVITTLGNTSDVITDLVQLPGGQFLVSATQSISNGASSVVLAKYNSDGSIDTSYGTNGFSSTALNPGNGGIYTYDMRLDADGKVFVIGQESRNLGPGDASTTPFILKFNTDGSLDTTFGGGDGKVSLQVGSFIDNLYKIVEQTDGKLIVSGLSFYTGTENHGFLARFNTDGSLDTSFGEQGIAWSPFPAPGDDSFQSIELTADGKIIAIGFSGPPNPVGGVPHHLVVVRYNADGTVDTSFNPENTVDNSVGFTEHGAAVVLDSHAAVYDANLALMNSYEGATLTLQRETGASADDVFGATNAVGLSGSTISVDGVDVATVTSVGGVLTITFGEGSTQAVVNLVMSSITYSNSSSTPPESVAISWFFSDGNTGAQGVGESAAAIGSTTVNITAINDDPIVPVGHSHTLEGTSGDDTFVSGKGSDKMYGGDGDDTYIVNGAGDKAYEDEDGGIDTVKASANYSLGANVENLVLTGSDGYSGKGNELDNEITGNDGRNQITGNFGADTLTGNGGADRFIYKAVLDSPAGAGNFDVITDFSSAQGDRIVLEKVDANAALRGNQDFHFIGTAAFSADATGELRFDAATHMLYGSTDADADPEFAIELTGVTSLSASDLQL